MTHDLNIWAAWIGVLSGVLTGIWHGLHFHDIGWLGGYASWKRRLMRLGHISFFGIAILNLAFAWTIRDLHWRPDTLIPSISLAAAQVLMPLVCYLAAWRGAMRRLFFLPVSCVLIAICGLLWSRAVP